MVLIELLIERWHTFERLVAIVTKSRVSITLCASVCVLQGAAESAVPRPCHGLREGDLSLSVFH